MARIIDAFTQFFHPVTGKPLVNGKLQFFESGTNNTNKDTFKDASLTPGLENTNPVILDGGGNLAFSVFGTGIYNVIMFDENGVQLKQFDPVGATDGGSQFSEWLATSVYDESDIVRVGLDYYQSVINGNSNNNPATSPAEWDLITIVKSYIADASGTVDAITADFTPNMHSLANNTRVLVRALGANATTTPTFAPNGLTAKTIVKNGNQPLATGDTSGEMDMVYNSSNDNWELLNPSSTGVLSTDSLLYIEDQKTNGTSGGSSAANAFQTRDLNTVITNTIAGASLSSNIITLPEGNYYIEALAPAFGVDRNQLALRDIIAASDVVIGMSSQFVGAPNVVAGIAPLFGKITVVGTRTFDLRHYTQTAIAVRGLGEASSGSGLASVFSNIKIWKV